MSRFVHISVRTDDAAHSNVRRGRAGDKLGDVAARRRAACVLCAVQSDSRV